jgi:hypothetical protein
MKRSAGIVICFLCFLFGGGKSFAQSDSARAKLYRPNSIKLNLTSNVLYSPSIILSYERTLNEHSTLVFEAGNVRLPSLGGIYPLGLKEINETKKTGFMVAADYRMYFRRENKFTAPHGLYWGPYASYYSFKNERLLSTDDTTVATGELNFITTIQATSLGVNLGYQFSLWKDRIVIDMLMFGPSFTYYKAKLRLDGDIDVNEQNQYLQDLLNFMIDSFPVIKDLVENQEISSNGTADLFFAGYRYSVKAGFRF